MRIRSSRWVALAAVCLAAVVTVTLVRVLVHDKKHQSTDTATTRTATIPASGGARLSAGIYAPSGHGPYPLIVMPASWGSAATEYAAVATGFAALGYLVVAYAQRGLGGSTGDADFAGTATVGDVSTVIDWARDHADANTSRVALVGASYGAGVSLLAAEHDARIKVVAALSGWADFTRAMAPGNTPNKVDYQLLFTGTIANTSLTPQLRTLVSELSADRPAAALHTIEAMSPQRSPMTDVAALNANHTAVFVTSTYQDSLGAPNDLIDFFRALTGPKRLELDVGDHGADLLAGLRGHKTPLWVDVGKWVARYLDHRASLDNSRPVLLRDTSTDVTHDYPDWAAVGTDRTYSLGAQSGAPATGELTPGKATGWSRTITAAVPTSAQAGPEQVTTGAPYSPPSVTLSSVSRTAGAIWTGAATSSPTLVNGIPSVHVDVRATAPTATLFAYLYDVDSAGTGRLITFGTQTLNGSTLSQGEPADISLGAISWTVPAGHRLALVVDSADARYLGQSVPGSTITLLSAPADPARLTVPVG